MSIFFRWLVFIELLLLLREGVKTIFFRLLMFLKIVMFSWKQYWESFRNRFDAAITILSLSCTIFVYYPNHFSDARLIRFVVMARVLRLVAALAVHGPDQPAVGNHAQAPSLGAWTGRSDA